MRSVVDRNVVMRCVPVYQYCSESVDIQFNAEYVYCFGTNQFEYF